MAESRTPGYESVGKAIGGDGIVTLVLGIAATASRMSIDYKLTDGEAGTFTNINPTIEDVRGEVSDASRPI